MTGTYESNDDARRIRETYTTVRNYQFTAPTFYSLIDGPTYGYVYQQSTWEAVTRCGVAPFSYEWRTSTDGFNYGSVRSTDETFSEYLPWTDGYYYYIQLRVTSADGQVSTSTTTIYLDYSNAGGRLAATDQEFRPAPIRWGNISSGVTPRPESEIKLDLISLPNPADQKAVVEFVMPKKQHVLLEAYTAEGKRVNVLREGIVEAGRHREEWSVSNLANGIYIYRLTTNDGNRSARIVVAH